MIWDRIRQWFKNVVERKRTIDEFNENAKEAFYNGSIGVLFSADESTGDPNFRHPYSKFLFTAFRINSSKGRPLTREEILYIGRVILNDTGLTRRLYYLGWDTLRVQDPVGHISARWAIKDYVNFTPDLPERL